MDLGVVMYTWSEAKSLGVMTQEVVLCSSPCTCLLYSRSQIHSPLRHCIHGEDEPWRSVVGTQC